MQKDSKVLTPQQANVVVLEFAYRVLDAANFDIPELDWQSQLELWKAAARYKERVLENLNYARKQVR